MLHQCVQHNVIYYIHVGQPRTCENLHRAINRGDLEMVKTILEERYILPSLAINTQMYV